MVGRQIIEQRSNDSSVILITRNRSELDLTKQNDVEEFFSQNKIDEVYLAAARVGGIHANNTYPAEFIYENIMIGANVIHASHTYGVGKLLFLGSSCIYPKFADQPIGETELLTGSLEPTNSAYALAKICGIEMCNAYHKQFGSDFRGIMPTNLYGPNDNFDKQNSHVIPGLIRRFHEAKINEKPNVEVWGTGNPRREFLHVKDLAKAAIHVMNLSETEFSNLTNGASRHLNVGTGEDCSISDIAQMIADIVGYEGKISWDISKPDGTPRKLLDISRISKTGWQATVPLSKGLERTYAWYTESLSKIPS